MSKGTVAVVILSHRDADLLRRSVGRILDGRDTVVVVHHDPRGPEPALPRSDRVVLVPDAEPCDWGRMNLARATLRGLQHAHRIVPELSWALLVSGQDYPCRRMTSIEDELATTLADAFVRHFVVPPRHVDGEHPWQTRTRQRYLHRVRLPFTHRGLPFPRMHRFRAGTHLFVGDMWVNLSAAALDHLLLQRERLGFVERYLARSPVPDEALIPTLLLNDAGHLQMVNDRRRYIRWTEGAKHPATLSLEDVPKAVASSAFFARKVDSRTTPEVLDAFDASLGSSPGV